MALPSTNFDLATIPAPSSDITGFTSIIDHANDSASYIADINTTDGTRGRIAKHSDGTEYAKDPIDFNSSSDRGLTRFYYGTILAASTAASRQVRKYPPNTRNAAYGVSDTYGQYNAYDGSWELYWPSGGGSDRTSNQRTGTANGGVSVGGTTGNIGVATVFDGSDDYVIADFSPSAYPITLSAWANSNGTNINTPVCIGSNTNDSLLRNYNVFGTIRSSMNDSGGEIGQDNISGGYPDSAWNMMGGRFTSSEIEAHSAGAYSGSATGHSSSFPTTLVKAVSGAGLFGSGISAYFNGTQNEVQIHSATRSDDYILEEYDQTNDNSTFWGTWTWTTSGTITLEGSTDSITLLSGSLGILTNLSGSADSITLLSGDIELLTSLIGSLESITLLSGELGIITGVAGSIDSITLLSGTLGEVGFIELEGSLNSITLLSGNVGILTSLAGSIHSITLLSAFTGLFRRGWKRIRKMFIVLMEERKWR